MKIKKRCQMCHGSQLLEVNPETPFKKEYMAGLEAEKYRLEKKLPRHYQDLHLVICPWCRTPKNVKCLGREGLDMNKVQVLQHGIVHMIAHCFDCDFSKSDYRDPDLMRRQVRRHVVITGHKVTIETGKSTLYQIE